jgi:hypothetical protein
MNDKFDELAKGLAQSVTRRQPLRHFGLGLTGAVLASVGLAPRAEAHPRPHGCRCKKPDFGCGGDLNCQDFCGICCAGGCF